MDEVPSDSASFFTFPDGLTEYYPGELEQTTITERRVQQFNQFHQLGLSAGLRWQPTLFREVPTFVKVHYAYYPLRWAEGRSLTPSLGYAPFEDPELESTLPKQFSMLNLQAGTAWRLSASLQLEAGIFYQRTLSNASAVAGVKLRYQSWGGTAGAVLETLKNNRKAYRTIAAVPPGFHSKPKAWLCRLPHKPAAISHCTCIPLP